MRPLAWGLLCCLAACGGGSATDAPSAPVDQTLQRETSAGQLAFQLERPDEAVARYQEALRRAQARDDLTAIGDLGYNLAVAELEANHPDKALEVARSTIEEMERRGSTPFAGLTLVEATALYRSGDLTGAEATARKAASASDKQVAARATFLLGLIADDRGDLAGLTAAATSLRDESDPSLQADAAELAARLALRHRDFTGARQQAEQAAALRQKTLDYRGLARVLAVGAEAAEKAGDAKAAADLYLRAGRSAAAQGDDSAARTWLQNSAKLATDDSVRDAANALLKGLVKPSPAL
jgi:tetratricopeptide (TPR) repeat protein